jgi:hypothetical protein
MEEACDSALQPQSKEASWDHRDNFASLSKIIQVGRSILKHFMKIYSLSQHKNAIRLASEIIYNFLSILLSLKMNHSTLLSGKSSLLLHGCYPIFLHSNGMSFFHHEISLWHV